MIVYKNEYYKWIESRGVGSRDVVASSPDSYISYLNSVSDLIRKDISPSILGSERDIERIADEISDQRSPKTINNYKSAMRQYVSMVQGGIVK
jgi:uncharacterized protein YaaR (DUF327 family)